MCSTWIKELVRSAPNNEGELTLVFPQERGGRNPLFPPGWHLNQLLTPLSTSQPAVYTGSPGHRSMGQWEIRVIRFVFSIYACKYRLCCSAVKPRELSERGCCGDYFGVFYMTSFWSYLFHCVLTHFIFYKNSSDRKEFRKAKINIWGKIRRYISISLESWC